MFWRRKPPEITREQSLASAVVPSGAVRARRDERGIVTLEVPFAASPLIERISRLLGGEGGKRELELDEVGSSVWEMCDGRTTIRQMTDRLSETYKISRKEAEVSLTSFVRTLGRKGLVAVVVPAPRKEPA